MYVRLIFCLMTASCSMASAQITLTAATCNPSPGDTVRVYRPNTSNPGSSGANVIWDFSSTATGPHLFVLNSYDCFLQPVPVGEISIDTGSQLCTRLRFNNSNLVVFNFNYSTNNHTYYDTRLILQYPLTFNSQTYTDSFHQYHQGNDGARAETIISSDAYGTLILPDSTYTDVIRVKTIETGHNFAYYGMAWHYNNYQKINYDWYNSTNKLPLLSMSLLQYYYSTVVEAVEEQEIVSIYPNPASDVLNIQAGGNGHSSCTITDNIGQLVLHQSIHDKETTINIASLPPGLYYINLKGEQGATVRKFVKL